MWKDQDVRNDIPLDRMCRGMIGKVLRLDRISRMEHCSDCDGSPQRDEHAERQCVLLAMRRGLVYGIPSVGRGYLVGNFP
jgi:hypothetical protein